ncbi:MAG TPA: class I SAM-dependent methyltransferase [Opitutaceae bacterium]|nr:class I SAM-dependent methyltransferase [Opitutaceae bacterium]
MSTPLPEILFCLDHPTVQPTTDTVAIKGWVASPAVLGPVRVVTADGNSGPALSLMERPDVRAAHPEMANVTGFSARCPAAWMRAGSIELTYEAGGKRHRFSRALPHVVDPAAKARKLDRIAPLLRSNLASRRTAHHFDFLSPELRDSYNIIETEAVSSNRYDGIALDLLRRHPDGLILDAGAGSREDYLPNVVNFEIAPYPSTDVLGVGEELPFVDNAFDAVFSLAVLEHVKDPFRCARELARVLKPGGTLYVAVPFLQHYHGYPHHYYNMSHQGLANLFAGTLDVKEQRVLESGRPIWMLSWFLQIYCEGLPAAEREKFKRMTVADFLADPGTQLARDFVTKLPEETNFKLATTTVLLAVKPAKGANG